MAPDVNRETDGGPDAVKDLDAAHPIPGAWRPIFSRIVSRFAQGDFSCSGSVTGVAPIPASTADQIREYVNEYGATLIELPEPAWATSVAQWMGSHWDVLVDLWTLEEGRSDLVLHAQVEQIGGDPRITVQTVCVP